MKPQLQNWTHLPDFKPVRSPRTEVLVVSRDAELRFELGSLLQGRYRVRTLDSARAITAPKAAARWLAIIDTVSPVDARADVAIMQEQFPLAPMVVVTHTPQQWSAALARGNIVAALAREELRSARLTEALSAAERRLANEHGAARAARAPAPLARPALALLPALVGLLLLDLALSALWVLAAPGMARGVAGLPLGGAAVATLLLPVVLYALRRARESLAAAALAVHQIADILGSIREGWFIIQRDLRLGASCSGSLTDMLRLPAPAGRRFEDVLEPLLDPPTLGAARTFLRLLWQDEADEQAIASTNPLSQVEVCFPDAHGGRELRYLSFTFRRAPGAEPADDCVLGIVEDITERVLLARELERAMAECDSQAGLLQQQLRLDPSASLAFLESADSAIRNGNALLGAAGLGAQQLQTKLHGLQRELQCVKLSAAELGLASFTARLQHIDDTLLALRFKASLSSHDLLPVVVGLDDLMSHVATTRAIQAQIASLREQAAQSSRRPASEPPLRRPDANS
jgi:hypothetical protein